MMLPKSLLNLFDWFWLQSNKDLPLVERAIQFVNRRNDLGIFSSSKSNFEKILFLEFPPKVKMSVEDLEVFADEFLRKIGLSRKNADSVEVSHKGSAGEEVIISGLWDDSEALPVDVRIRYTTLSRSEFEQRKNSWRNCRIK